MSRTLYTVVRNGPRDWRVWSVAVSGGLRECCYLYTTARAARLKCAALNRGQS